MSNENKQSISVSYQRTNAVPLDESTVFHSFIEAAEYVKNNNTTAYEGQIITVDDGYRVVAYKVIKDNSSATGLDIEDIRYFTFNTLQKAGIDSSNLHVVARGATDTSVVKYAEGIVILPTTCTQINNRAFEFGGLTYINIPDSVTSIGTSAFYGCSGLTSIKMSNSVESIGDEAFADCTGLMSITIPNSVTYIGIAAFDDCTSLASIVYNGTTEQWDEVTKNKGWSRNVLATYVQCTDGKVTIS